MTGSPLVVSFKMQKVSFGCCSSCSATHESYQGQPGKSWIATFPFLLAAVLSPFTFIVVSTNHQYAGLIGNQPEDVF